MERNTTSLFAGPAERGSVPPLDTLSGLATDRTAIVPAPPPPRDSLLAFGYAGPLRAPEVAPPPLHAALGQRLVASLRPALTVAVMIFAGLAYAMTPPPAPEGLTLTVADPAPSALVSGAPVAFVHAPELAPALDVEPAPSVRRATPASRARAADPAPARTRAPAPSVTLEQRPLEELMRLASGMPSSAPTSASTDMDAPAVQRMLRPSRDTVAATMRTRSAAVRRCEGEGVATATVFFDGATGRARSVSVRGVDDAAAACVADALRGVRVEPFLQERLVVNFPYRL